MADPEEHEVLLWLRGLDPAARERFAAMRRADLARRKRPDDDRLFEMRVHDDGAYVLTVYYRPRLEHL
jgi:hypothetical protein